ncbi:hypothetical protein GCAAIG_03155 [Candidatus Electronema halotolerans]
MTLRGALGYDNHIYSYNVATCLVTMTLRGALGYDRMMA